MACVNEPLLSTFTQPVVLCDRSGEVYAWNQEYEELLGPPSGARIQYGTSMATLVLHGGQSLPVGVIAREDGTFLAHLLPQANTQAVARLVSRGLLQLQETLESSVGIALMEEPDGPSAHILREILAGTQEMSRLRRQLTLLGEDACGSPLPVSLRGLVRDALEATSFDAGVIFAESAPHCSVEVARELLFPALVGVISLLSQGAEAPLEVLLSEGEQVRLSLRVQGQELGQAPEIEQARRVVLRQGGRLLVIGDTLLIELPPYRSTTDIPRVDRSATVLVIDDDDTVLAMMEATLRRAGFRVLLAENGVDGSAMLREHPEIDAVVADAVLPGRSGVDLAKEARRRDLPVLLISGHDRDLLGDLDMPILPKPFGGKQLAETVGRMVEDG